MADLSNRVVPRFRSFTDREAMEVELSPEARRTRLGSKGLLFARLDRPAVPRGRRASKKDVQASPLLTAALYGPDDGRATKLVLSFIPSGAQEPTALERWVSQDVLADAKVLEEARGFLAAHPAAGITVTGGTIGCPHEEGDDFPTATDCPLCPFWTGKQRSS